jgi:hypothetical protein
LLRMLRSHARIDQKKSRRQQRLQQSYEYSATNRSGA